jgi:outer membrane protein assembly factor BamB
LTRIDLRTGTVDRLNAGVPSLPLAASAVVAGDDIWLGNWDGEVARFDTTTRKITDRLTLGTGLGAAGADAGGAMWYFNYNTETVTRIDATTVRATAAITVEHNPLAIISDARAVWILHAGGLVSRIDVDAQEVTDVIDPGPQQPPGGFANVPLPPVVPDDTVWVVAPDGQVYRLVAAS